MLPMLPIFSLTTPWVHGVGVREQQIASFSSGSSSLPEVFRVLEFWGQHCNHASLFFPTDFVIKPQLTSVVSLSSVSSKVGVGDSTWQDTTPGPRGVSALSPGVKCFASDLFSHYLNLAAAICLVLSLRLYDVGGIFFFLHTHWLLWHGSTIRNCRHQNTDLVSKGTRDSLFLKTNMSEHGLRIYIQVVPILWSNVMTSRSFHIRKL